jgi:hypothetical protein
MTLSALPPQPMTPSAPSNAENPRLFEKPAFVVRHFDTREVAQSSKLYCYFSISCIEILDEA